MAIALIHARDKRIHARHDEEVLVTQTLGLSSLVYLRDNQPADVEHSPGEVAQLHANDNVALEREG